MPSADFCRFIASPLDDASPKANRQISPGIAHSPSRLCPPHIRHDFPCRYWTLKILAFSSSPDASYAVSVRRASVLPAASSVTPPLLSSRRIEEQNFSTIVLKLFLGHMEFSISLLRLTRLSTMPYRNG